MNQVPVLVRQDSELIKVWNKGEWSASVIPRKGEILLLGWSEKISKS